MDLSKLCLNGSIACIDPDNFAVLGERHPLDHIPIKTLPAILEQGLLGKPILGIQHQNLGLGFVVLEVMRHHADPLVRSRWAAVRVGWRRHQKHPTIRHGIQLLFQQRRLCSCFPGMGRQLGSLLVVALDRIPLEINARRENQLVIGQACASCQSHGFLVSIDPLSQIMHDLDAKFAQFIIGVRLLVECPQAADIQVSERASVKNFGWFDQGHRNRWVATLDVFGSRRTAKSTTNHHH